MAAERKVALPVRLYGALLRLLPRDVRDADAVEMRATFAALWCDAVRDGGRVTLLARVFCRLPGVMLVEWLDRWFVGRTGPTPEAESGIMDRVVRSIRYAGRSLWRSPAFVWSVVLLLGLGVGGVTTIFTLFDHVMLRPLPYPAADRLFELQNGAHSGPIWRGLQDLRTVEAWTAVWTETANLTESGPPEQVRTARVSEDFLAMFGARPERGRLLVAEDFRTQDAVVISEGLWRRTFGGDPEMLGRTVVLDGRPSVVVGVMDRAFTPPEALTASRVDVWRPIDWTDERFNETGFHVLSVAGRLPVGGTLDVAQAEVAGLVERLAAETPEQWRQRDGTLRDLPVVQLQDATVGTEVREGLGLLLGAVSLLLLVACINVAHLFLARGLTRVREMAVRRALGGRTHVLAGQLLSESLIVGAAGAALGVALSYVGVGAFMALNPEAIPRASAIRIDLRVLSFAVAIGVTTALVFGMLPALRLLRREVTNALHGTGRGNSDTRFDRRMRVALVVAEVALSLMLVVQAGALLRGFARLNAEDLGFRTENVWTVPLEPRNLDAASEWTRRMDRVRAAVAAVPGVRLATYAMTMPLEWTGGTRCCWSTYPGFPGTEAREIVTAMHVVDTDYFPLLDLDFVAGRAWSRAEENMAPAPAVISEPLAIQVFGSAAGAIGRALTSSPQDEHVHGVGEAGRPSGSFHIVGVVADNRHYGPDQLHGAAAYMPAPTIPFPLDRAHIAVLADVPTDGLAARLRDAIWSVEPDLPVPTIRTLGDWAGEATARARFEAAMFSTFGVVALLLVAGGLYGTLLYAVGRRRRELGIRLALGDAPRRIERRVLGQAIAAAALGCAFGVFGAWGLGRFLASRVSSVQAGDPVLLAAAVAVLFAVALCASWLPARRAARTDPLEALRAE